MTYAFLFAVFLCLCVCMCVCVMLFFQAKKEGTLWSQKNEHEYGDGTIFSVFVRNFVIKYFVCVVWCSFNCDYKCVCVCKTNPIKKLCFLKKIYIDLIGENYQLFGCLLVCTTTVQLVLSINDQRWSSIIMCKQWIRL